jgi:hypothetical protein
MDSMKRKSDNKKRKPGKAGHHEYPLPGEIKREQSMQNADAHQQAEKDMADDAEFIAHSKNDDLDEGETARLGENTDLV